MPDFTSTELIDLKRATDARGDLYVAELGASLPFSPARLFIVSGVPTGETRGHHAHRSCHQFLICTAGAIDVVVSYPDSREDETVSLDSPDRGLHIRPLTWSYQRYRSAGATLLVAASEPYDPAEYIVTDDEYRRLATRLAEPGKH